ncbi:MAG: cytidine deaminase [Flavobacteriales bacterium]
MQRSQIINYTEYRSVAELDEEMQLLFKRVAKARESAYAPYSKFKVGAAIRLEGGQIICGNNQENAVYPVGLCAERVAIFQAGASYPGVRIRALVILAGSELAPTHRPVPPCGSCRQAIAEYERRQGYPIRIACKGVGGGPILEVGTVRDLLPFGFSKDFL